MVYLAAVAAIAAVAMGLLALRAWQAKQALTLKAGPLAQARPGGLVHVMGRVAPQGELLTSPKLGKECVYYRSVEKIHRPPEDTKGTGTTSVKSFEEDWVDFVIEDATGRVKVLADRATFILEKDFDVSEKVGRRREPVEVLGLEFSPRDRRATLIETETFIEPGDLVRVVGSARGSAPRTDTPNPTLFISKAGSPVFVITDKPKGDLLQGFGQRAMALGIGAALMLGIAVLSLGIGLQPPPEADPVKVDTTLKPIPRVQSPSAD